MSDATTALDAGVLTLTFRRAAQHNALTWDMYAALVEACERADADDEVRALVVRGDGGRAFVAGTDIGQFAAFTSGADGVAYEKRVTEVLDRIRAVQVPTVSAVEGYCVGGGLGIACATALRIATPGSRFGVPIARTLGNCLSARTLDLLVESLGRALTADLLLTARFLETDEARRVPGFLHAVVDDLDAGLAELTPRLTGGAPLTIWATKELLRGRADGPDRDDSAVVERVYGSADFRAAVAAFGDRRPPTWTGN
ncbi:Enoyl-CoA hydratase [Pseudonocardia sp. Ae168_Ps1]|uniref:enoyl-CoA hydratase n=1 Tax=unclassified Pseudonocardia TaxID=2619320 RepID=UPI00094B2B66|nr:MULTISPECIES: enoyl-CoA hydratase [unclassified Pseudonocardia]OLL73011.1 Enoyl-CoA hydratase [Pseudonocardia sp. Ae150A_Ps1]OLL78987.1 Enoyl-CoA hydratase [Pseudonocardia sp. Ae168_Ps1]OLL86875.1 Enoyl-CoA hydratase [Pseudonocardia sp. Ae263_Ps1]OLL93080.1 Enoyl-CoA hydratase [Pseudonocardia sp. Ae356_Ps1]